MTLAMDMADPRRRGIEAKLRVESIPIIDRFLCAFAKEKRWGAAAMYRLRAAAEEALLSLIAEEKSPSRNARGTCFFSSPGQQRG